jgi:uncharacterized protein (DUF305 family)
LHGSFATSSGLVVADDLIAHMRGRLARVRRVLALAHDPEMITILEEIIESGEADIRTLEAERAADQSIH